MHNEITIMSFPVHNEITIMSLLYCCYWFLAFGRHKQVVGSRIPVMYVGVLKQMGIKTAQHSFCPFDPEQHCRLSHTIKWHEIKYEILTPCDPEMLMLTPNKAHRSIFDENRVHTFLFAVQTNIYTIWQKIIFCR